MSIELGTVQTGTGKIDPPGSEIQMYYGCPCEGTVRVATLYIYSMVDQIYNGTTSKPISD